MFEAIALNLKASTSNFQLQTQKGTVARATALFYGLRLPLTGT